MFAMTANLNLFLHFTTSRNAKMPQTLRFVVIKACAFDLCIKSYHLFTVLKYVCQNPVLML